MGFKIRSKNSEWQTYRYTIEQLTNNSGAKIFVMANKRLLEDLRVEFFWKTEEVRQRQSHIHTKTDPNLTDPFSCFC